MSEKVLRELTERLARLEAEVSNIKDLLQHERAEAGKPWWESIAGSHKGDEVFAEIARLGAEIRRRDREPAHHNKRGKQAPTTRKGRGKVRPGARDWTRQP